jgi:hypothetical protein
LKDRLSRIDDTDDIGRLTLRACFGVLHGILVSLKMTPAVCVRFPS